MIACADGTASRRNPLYRGQTFEFCSGPHPCLPEFGQVCLVLDGTWRCVCKLGMIRPKGPSIRCIPIEALSNAQGATTNCSELIEDIDLIYNSTFGGKLRIESIHSKDSFKSLRDAPRSNVSQALRNEQFSIDNLSQVHIRLNNSKICNPNDKDSCKEMGGICESRKGQNPSCVCPQNQKLVDGKCISKFIESNFAIKFNGILELLDECSDPKLNDCDENAICMDNELSYECLCREGYIDTSDSPTVRPGIKCQKREFFR